VAETKAVTVKLDRELYQSAADVAALTGTTLRQLLSDALVVVIARANREPRMRATLKQMQAFRDGPRPEATDGNV